MSKIKNKVYTLRKDEEVSKGMTLNKGQEIQIATDVVYVNGNMIPPAYQNLFYTWITENPDKFIDSTNKF